MNPIHALMLSNRRENTNCLIWLFFVVYSLQESKVTGKLLLVDEMKKNIYIR